MRLTAQNLIKRFKNRTVVNGASFHINQGEVVGLLGPNGAGKSTTLKALFGLLTVSQGKISFNGGDITNMAPEALVPMRPTNHVSAML